MFSFNACRSPGNAQRHFMTLFIKLLRSPETTSNPVTYFKTKVYEDLEYLYIYFIISCDSSCR